MLLREKEVPRLSRSCIITITITAATSTRPASCHPPRLLSSTSPAFQRISRNSIRHHLKTSRTVAHNGATPSRKTAAAFTPALVSEKKSRPEQQEVESSVRKSDACT